MAGRAAASGQGGLLLLDAACKGDWSGRILAAVGGAVGSNGEDRAGVGHTVGGTELSAHRKGDGEAAVGAQVAAAGGDKLGVRSKAVGIGDIHLVVLGDAHVEPRSRGGKAAAGDLNGVATGVESGGLRQGYGGTGGRGARAAGAAISGARCCRCQVPSRYCPSCCRPQFQ